MDGGAIGEIEYENFNAASAVVTIHGLGIHPGSAKDKMKNAAAIAAEFQHAAPLCSKRRSTPRAMRASCTCTGCRATCTEATMAYLVRDHDHAKFEAKKAVLHAAGAFLNAKYGEGTVDVTITRQLLQHAREGGA